MTDTKNFLFCACGIFVLYFYFGILQEKITRGQYSKEVIDESGNTELVDEKFTYSLSLVFLQCFINYLFAKGISLTRSEVEDKTQVKYYISSALTYLLAMVCSNMALQWVPYPTQVILSKEKSKREVYVLAVLQVIGKSAKPIPVMVLGVLIGKRSYSLKKYVFVLLIVVGIVLFMYKDKLGVTQSESSVGLGELLLLLSLTMDGLTGAVQVC